MDGCRKYILLEGYGVVDSIIVHNMELGKFLRRAQCFTLHCSSLLFVRYIKFYILC